MDKIILVNLYKFINLINIIFIVNFNFLFRI